MRRQGAEIRAFVKFANAVTAWGHLGERFAILLLKFHGLQDVVTDVSEESGNSFQIYAQISCESD